MTSSRQWMVFFEIPRIINVLWNLSCGQVDSLRVMLLGMVNDPRVVLIKLADRLHNMRTM